MKGSDGRRGLDGSIEEIGTDSRALLERLRNGS
jgi:hypothetical protein